MKCSSEQAQWNICEPVETLSARRRKTLANFKRDEDIIFWTKLFFFHQECFCSKRVGIFKNASKKKFSKNPQIRSSDSENHEKIYETFGRKLTFLQMFLRTCKMQLWPPCRNFLEKTLKTFCWNSENDEKLIEFPGNLLVKMFVWTCTMKFRHACRKIVGKNAKNTPKIHKRWIYILSNKIVFFLIKNDSLATENAILTMLAKTFL